MQPSEIAIKWINQISDLGGFKALKNDTEGSGLTQQDEGVREDQQSYP